jgi:hypothetical protein
MKIEDVLNFFFAVYGLQNIIAIGRPTAFIRSALMRISPTMKEFFGCALCVGFWAGALIGIYLFLARRFFPEITWYPLLPLVGAGVCYFFRNLTFFAELPSGDTNDK